MIEPLISVIIPVYNAKAYIAICIDSLRCQTYKNLEIILVDDGSSDGSGEICDSYAKMDCRVRVIHQSNQGVSMARNAGLACATGDFISYIDADDYIKEDYFEYLYQKLIEQNVDMVCCNFIEIQNEKEVRISPIKVLKSRKILDYSEVFIHMADQVEPYWSCVWGKLIKSDFAKKVIFTHFIKYGEDQIYMFDLFCMRPNVYLDTYKGYFYIRNESSATITRGEYNIKRCIDELRMYEYKCKHLPEELYYLKGKYLSLLAIGIQYLAQAVVMTGSKDEKVEYRKDLLQRIKEIEEYKFKFSARTRVLLGLYQYFPLGYSVLIRVRYIINKIRKR